MSIKKLTFGVTLIELMVVLAIVCILALVGFPSYEHYLMGSRRSDAINTLRENQLLIENYRYKNGATPGSGDVTFITTSPAGFYTIAYTQVSNNRYRLVATAVGSSSQANDTGCTVITLTSEMDDIYPAECH